MFSQASPHPAEVLNIPLVVSAPAVPSVCRSIKITTSCYPVPSICCHDLVYDWFDSLAQCLHWNVRKKQTRLSEASDSSDTEN